MRVDLNSQKENAVFRILVSAFSIQIYILTPLNANEYNKEEL